MLEIMVYTITGFILMPKDCITIIIFSEESLPNPIIKDKRRAIGRAKPNVTGISKRRILIVLKLNPNLRRDIESSIVKRKRKKIQLIRKINPISFATYL